MVGPRKNERSGSGGSNPSRSALTISRILSRNVGRVVECKPKVSIRRGVIIGSRAVLKTVGRDERLQGSSPCLSAHMNL